MICSDFIVQCTEKILLSSSAVFIRSVLNYSVRKFNPEFKSNGTFFILLRVLFCGLWKYVQDPNIRRLIGKLSYVSRLKRGLEIFTKKYLACLSGRKSSIKTVSIPLKVLSRCWAKKWCLNSSFCRSSPLVVWMATCSSSFRNAHAHRWKEKVTAVSLMVLYYLTIFLEGR